MKEWLLTGIALRPIIMGLAGYGAAHTLMFAVIQIPFVDGLFRINYFGLVWGLLLGSALGVCVGLLAKQRPFQHTVYSLLLGGVTLSVVAGHADILSFLFFNCIPSIVGAFFGHLLAVRHSHRAWVRREKIGWVDMLVLVLSLIVPVTLWATTRQAASDAIVNACGGDRAVDESCARKICEQSITGRLRFHESPTSYLFSEKEILREPLTSDGATQMFWHVRGTVGRRNANSDDAWNYDLYICRVDEKAGVVSKTSPTDSDRYPAKGTVLRDAFEAKWER